MADNLTITFRPRDDQHASYMVISDWCRENDYPISAVFNSYIDAIAYGLCHFAFVDQESGILYIKSDFGDVPVFKRNQNK